MIEETYYAWSVLRRDPEHRDWGWWFDPTWMWGVGDGPARTFRTRDEARNRARYLKAIGAEARACRVLVSVAVCD